MALFFSRRDYCYRCLTPRYANGGGKKRPPRETNFPGRPPHDGVSREPTTAPSTCAARTKGCPRPQSQPGTTKTGDMKAPGEAQALLKALKGFGVSQELLQQVQQSLVPAQKPVTSRLRQLAHVDEQLKALRNRMQRQSKAIERHQEQLERMQEKLLNMSVEEDKLKEEIKSLENAPPFQCSSHPVSICGHHAPCF